MNSNISELPGAGHAEELRILEALLFAAPEPLSESDILGHIQPKAELSELLNELRSLYSGRGVQLVQIGGAWAFRTAQDLAPHLVKYRTAQKKLSKAALETLAIVAYHQPVTRAEIEDVRGVKTSSGTLDILLELNWIRMRGRRRSPGRPITYGTTELFLDQFGFENISDLPGLNELKGAGLLSGNLPPGFEVPRPDDSVDLREDEEELGSEDDPLDYRSETDLAIDD